jgi:hypothetical protein
MYKLTYSQFGKAHEISFESRDDAIKFYDELFLDLNNEFITLTENDKPISWLR